LTRTDLNGNSFAITDDFLRSGFKTSDQAQRLRLKRDFASDSLKLKVLSKLQADPPSPFDERRAMAGQVGKVVVPGIGAVCEHLPEVCAAPYCIKPDANPSIAGQRSL